MNEQLKTALQSLGESRQTQCARNALHNWVPNQITFFSATNYKWQSLCHSGSLEGQDPCHPCSLFLGSHLVPPRLHVPWSYGNTLAYRSDHVEMLKLGIEAA